MQFHLDGFRQGNTRLTREELAERTPNDVVDVLIVGAGPAGLVLASQLSRFPDISVRLIDKAAARLEYGRADGIACRSMEMFQAFGIADQVRAEAYHVNEVSFWNKDPETGELARTDRIEDVEDDLSEMPHLILSQARIQDFFMQTMEIAQNPIIPEHGKELLQLEISANTEGRIQALLCDSGRNKTSSVQARFVVGCDGARSKVRKEMGIALEGSSTNQLWGVVDVLAETDFPDIRLKSAVRNAEHGALLIIPREGGYLVRLYIELDELTAGERVADRELSVEFLIEQAQRILAPFTLDVKEVAWWSAYEIGQRACARFDDAAERADNQPRILIAGDACHTHSPKAGQGMNVSMADAFNLGWKLAAVVQGKANHALLKTYSQERQAKAQELIEFDKDMARFIATAAFDRSGGKNFQDYFQKHGRFTAGVETQYAPSMVVQDATHQALAKGLVVGKRFHSGHVIRVADAHRVHLGHVHDADGRWRLYAFAPIGDTGRAGGAMAELCMFLSRHPTSPLTRYTPSGADPDAVFDLRAVFSEPHRTLAVPDMPKLLRPRKGRHGLTDHEKVFAVDPGDDIYARRGVDRGTGALVVVRPDQFVADVLPLSARDRLSGFFENFMIET